MTAVAYNVQLDRSQIAEAITLFEFVGGNIDRALSVAINKTTPKAKTAASAQIRQEVRLKAAYVREQISIRKATRTLPQGALTSQKMGILLSRYSDDPKVAESGTEWTSPPPQPYGGMYVQVKPTGPAVKVGRGGESKPFYIVLKNSRRLGIARRQADGKINVLHAASVSQVFNTVRDKIRPAAADEFQKQLLDAMRYLLVKQYPPEA